MIVPNARKWREMFLYIRPDSEILLKAKISENPGNHLFDNEKGPEWFQSIGLQSPKEVILKTSNKKLILKPELVNKNIEKSLAWSGGTLLKAKIRGNPGYHLESGRHGKRWHKDQTISVQLFELSDTIKRIRGSSQLLAIKSSIIGKILKNEETGLEAIVSGESFRKIMSEVARKGSSSPQEHYQAIGNIDQLFPLATLKETRPGKKQNDENVIEAIHHFEVPMPFDDKITKVKIMVKSYLDKNQGSRIYLVNAVEAENAGVVGEDPVLSGQFQRELQKPASPPPSSVSLKFAQMVAIVKDGMRGKLEKSLTWSGHPLQGRMKFQGMDISIENKAGSIRSGVDADGHEWHTKMIYPYGYIRGTVGVDKDHVDCVSPDTRVLLGDFSERRAGDLKEGDVLVGCNESPEAGTRRGYKRTKVLNCRKSRGKMVRFTLSNGRVLETTPGHLHYVYKGTGRDKVWRRADKITLGDRLVKLFDISSPEVGTDYMKGYLVGAYLGDGSVNLDASRTVYVDIRVVEDDRAIIDRVTEYWKALGLATASVKIKNPCQTITPIDSSGRIVRSTRRMATLYIRGRLKVEKAGAILADRPDTLEWNRGFLAGLFDTDGCLNCRKEVQISQVKNQKSTFALFSSALKLIGLDARLISNTFKVNSSQKMDNASLRFILATSPTLARKRDLIGMAIGFEEASVVSIESYEGEFIALQTDLSTYVANGFVTHNCYIGPWHKSDKVFVIHQIDPETNKFDEDKVMLGFMSPDSAKSAYLAHYDRPDFFGSLEQFTVGEFKALAFSRVGRKITRDRLKNIHLVVSGARLKKAIERAGLQLLPAKSGGKVVYRWQRPNKDEDVLSSGKKKTQDLLALKDDKNQHRLFDDKPRTDGADQFQKDYPEIFEKRIKPILSIVQKVQPDLLPNFQRKYQHYKFDEGTLDLDIQLDDLTAQYLKKIGTTKQGNRQTQPGLFGPEKEPPEDYQEQFQAETKKLAQEINARKRRAMRISIGSQVETPDGVGKVSGFTGRGYPKIVIKGKEQPFFYDEVVPEHEADLLGKPLKTNTRGVA